MRLVPLALMLSSIMSCYAQEYYGPVFTPDPTGLGAPEQIHLMHAGGGRYALTWHSIGVDLGKAYRYQSTPAWDSDPPQEMLKMQDAKALGPFLSMVQYGERPDDLNKNATGVPVLWVDQRCGTTRFII